MKLRYLAAALAVAVAVSGCALLGISPDQSEPTRAKAESAVQTAEAVVAFGRVFFASACVPDSPICPPELDAAQKAAGGALSARLADVKAALAFGVPDEQRVQLAVAALIAAINDVTSIINAVEAAKANA